MPRPRKNSIAAPVEVQTDAAEVNEATEAGDSPKTEYMKAKCAVIGKNIREHRKQRRFSVENLAEYLDLSASYIGLLERGDRCPSLKIVYKLCDLFYVAPNELLNGKPEDAEMFMAENQAAYNAKTQIDAVVSLLRMLKENELEFVIDTIKNLRKIGR